MPAPTKAFTFDNEPEGTNPIDADEVNENFDRLYDWNTEIEPQLGVGTSARGKCIVATEQVRTDTAYGKLGTADEVTGIELEEDGLLFVCYEAEWESSVGAAGRAAIFLGSNQVKIAPGVGTIGTAPGLQSATTDATAGETHVLTTGPNGLDSGNGSDYTGGVTTGQIIGASRGTSGEDTGGVTIIRAAAGTYTVSVQFSSASGSVTVRSRKLWVWTMSFPD